MMKKSFQILFVAAFCLFTMAACQPSSNNPSSANGNDNKHDKSSAFATFDAVDAIEIVESPATGVALGWGWNRGDSEPVPTICVEFVPGEEPAQTRYMTMSEVHDSYDLMKSVGMSAEASVKTIGFEAEGKASFAKSQKLTGNKSHFVMNAIVQNGVRYASPIPSADSRVSEHQSATNERGGSSGSIRLTDEAVKKAKNIDAFRRHCGSSFVSAIYGGAKLTALLSMESSSKEEKEKLSAEMSGSGWGVKVKAKVDTESKATSGSEKMDVSIFMTGGKGDAIPITIKDLKAKMETISMDAYVAPKDFQIAITPYELLSNWPGKPLPDKESEFEELASYWGAYNTLYDDFQLVLNDPENYFDVPVNSQGMHEDTLCVKQYNEYQGSRKSLQRYAMDDFTDGQGHGPGGKELQNSINRKVNKMSQSMFAYAKCTLVDNSGAALTLPNIKQLKRAQDEVLLSLKTLEEEARVCSDKTDACDFEAGKYRSPYAFRAQLPVPNNSGVTSFKDLVDYKMGFFAKRRCQASSNDTDCLSNRELDNWGQKIGLISVNRKYQPVLFDNYLAKTLTGNAESIPAAAAVLEMGRDDVLWYNPNTPVVKP